tara:strand:+ start:238 stop:663 length:426 start_codon:yes stop_codon:yes gene_type:complete
MTSEKLEDQKNHHSQKKKKNKKEKIQIKDNENIIKKISFSIPPKLEHTPNTKIKLEKKLKLTKDKHYYKQNKEILRKKARKKYKEKMKNRNFRFDYLARQRDYNRRRKKKDRFKCLEIYNLLVPYNPFDDEPPILIVFDGD